jgi:hypothetical protein
VLKWRTCLLIIDIPCQVDLGSATAFSSFKFLTQFFKIVYKLVVKLNITFLLFCSHFALPLCLLFAESTFLISLLQMAMLRVPFKMSAGIYHEK